MADSLPQKEKMTTQYQDLISSIPVTITEKEQQIVNGYLRNVKLLKLVTISTLKGCGQQRIALLESEEQHGAKSEGFFKIWFI